MQIPLIAPSTKHFGLITSLASGTAVPVYLNDVLLGTTTKSELIISELYGKATRASTGTPSKDNPINIVSIGDSGTLSIDVNDGAATVTLTDLPASLSNIGNVRDSMTAEECTMRIAGIVLNHNYWSGDWYPTAVWGGIPGFLIPTHLENSPILCSHVPDNSTIMSWANAETLGMNGVDFGFTTYAEFIAWVTANNNDFFAMWQIDVPMVIPNDPVYVFPTIPVIAPETRITCETDLQLEL